MKKRIFWKLTAVLAALTAIFVSVFALSGCSFLFDALEEDYAEFSRSGITLREGESFDLGKIVVGESQTYTLSSADKNIASLSGRTLTARSVGETVITLRSGMFDDSLKVKVVEREPDALSVVAVGELVQTMGALSTVEFTAVATGRLKDRVVSWSVNGAFAEITEPSKPFSYTPSAAGEYEITAECEEFTASRVLRVFYAATASVSYEGETEQLSSPYSPIRFSVVIDGNDHNPDCYIQCFEDDVLVYDGNDMRFEYRPTPGRHNVSVYVNGKRESNVNVFARGAVTPSAPRLVYDNVYPHAYVDADVKGDMQVEITFPSGEKSVYSQSDPQYAALFGERGFDAGSLIEICATSSRRSAYTFRVKSLGDGDALTESEFSPAITFTQLPIAAAEYLRTECLDGDLYITSDEEYVKALEYNVIFRPKTSKSKVSFDCYIAYDMTSDAEDLWNDAFPIAATSGTYTSISVTLNNNIMRTSFTVNTVNNPTRQSTGSATQQLHAVLPHINYDEDKYRPADHVFPIDRLLRTTEVEYSDELYLAAQHNTCPLPRRGSVAETIYATARNILRKICTEEMTEVQKAHAIYDWILWQVTYDTPATMVERNGEAYSAYYLEGVFGDGNTEFGGNVYRPYAVCDGMSKAYALMCNIEGIPCVRVAGDAGSPVLGLGGHAWNKVCLDGNWYVVDCTWGDSQGELDLDGRRIADYELGLHDYLFVTDSDVSDTHYEPYRTGESFIRYSPQTAFSRYNVYSEMVYNGTVIDCFVKRNENQIERIRDIAAAFASAYESKRTITVPGGPNNGVYNIEYQGLEIYIDGGLTAADSSVNAAVTQAIGRILPRASVNVAVLDNTVLVLVRD